MKIEILYTKINKFVVADTGTESMMKFHALSSTTHVFIYKIRCVFSISVSLLPIA